MALHGWRLYGVVLIIFAYIVGILVLSVINMQGPQVTFPRSGVRFEEINRLRRRDLNGLNKRQPIQWCTPLHFLNLSEGRSNDNHSKGVKVTSKINGTDSSNTSYELEDRGKTRTYGLTALASFPGSGNTWLRYLLQQSTGILTGSIYKDYGLLKSGFPAENICNRSVLVVKTHEWGPKTWMQFEKAILLVRDPDKAILAEFNRQSGGHVGFASPDRYKRTKGRYWQQFVANKLTGWENMNLSWARNFTGRLKIIYYDDLVADVESALREILSFLNFPIDEELLSCALLHKEGIYRRKKRILSFDPYSPIMHKYIEQKKQKVYSALGRHV
ncbi:unnamed protein product [Hermetia illucens]|uniref:Uncharacterized protein n=1 Tax=Hermetia illucens TaxID=343691 RepID=A0A7R8YZB7_HERIL|nr:WSCD family member AAEL009094 [Hermetia illucens]XP_037917614.1 WSCD family member AAEL009094 [Hermetia illucens]XP_037917615.1 WSCD family member AAEL009094 [Hermetia illucens]XP_037917616.1 WSCD family member AAEL009094 [Hermetia illucens]CAD7087631.1 unnamed protein product [Hermetia illucens]